MFMLVSTSWLCKVKLCSVDWSKYVESSRDEGEKLGYTWDVDSSEISELSEN